MNVVITSGGTSEYIDKVRKITNSGTGKLGSIIANVLSQRNDIDEIYYICTPKSIRPKLSTKINIIEIIDTNSLKKTAEKLLNEIKIDWFIHSMAVSDYYVDYVSTTNLLTQEIKNNFDIENVIKNPVNKLDNSKKISSNEDNLIVVLKQTPKIINLIKQISPNTHLIGFKLLDNVSKEYLIEIAKKLRDKNNCDYVIANDLQNIKNGNHKALLIDKLNNIKELNGKENIAKEISSIVKK